MYDMKLLVVDDHMKIRNILKMMYGSKFSKVLDAESGEEAVRLYKNHMPDWVLMDVKMSILDGISATKEIIQFDKNAKVIIVTLFDDKFTQENALSAGAIDFVNKSDLTKIENIISRYYT